VDFGAQGDVEAGAVACNAYQEHAGPFKGMGHLEPPCVERPHVHALQKRRNTGFRLGAVAGEEPTPAISAVSRCSRGFAGDEGRGGHDGAGFAGVVGGFVEEEVDGAAGDVVEGFADGGQWNG
jgi:hypothetical protein